MNQIRYFVFSDAIILINKIRISTDGKCDFCYSNAYRVNASLL